MPSSTSNSKTNKKTRLAVIAFAATFVVLSGLGYKWGHLYPSESWMGTLPAVPPNDHYIVCEAYTDKSPDLYAFYYGIGPAIEAAKKADILIVGNSKPYYALRNPGVSDFEKATGLKVFNLAMPYGEGMGIAKVLIERHHLKPKVLLVNEDRFSSTYLSPYSQETIKMGYWRAFCSIFEENVSWYFRTKFHQIMPRFGFGKIFGMTPVIAYRSVQNGCLSMENFTEYHVPVADKKFTEEQLSPEETASALTFKKEMAAQGTQIILMSVPYGTDDSKHLDKWIADPERRALIAQAEQPYEKIDRTAKQLGLTSVTPHIAGLFTQDGVHLDEKSAAKFTTAFFESLEKNPVFRASFRPLIQHKK